MLFIVFIVAGAAVLSFIAMVLLLLLKLIFWILGVAGKTTFRIAKFGLKFAGSAALFVIALALLFVIGIFNKRVDLP